MFLNCWCLQEKGESFPWLAAGTTQTRFIWIKEQLYTLRANLGCNGESLRATRGEKPSCAEADLQPSCFTITSCVTPAAPEMTLCEMRGPTYPGAGWGVPAEGRGGEGQEPHAHVPSSVWLVGASHPQWGCACTSTACSKHRQQVHPLPGPHSPSLHPQHCFLRR